ncbi:MAG TPA: isoprenylcysteine carboxylmethyltransferase family protein [Thermoanaerobaculia bacterium]|nr:isoprenylcysteine carboxylmethyltransferase family protein [Thermoanaerobaculia bacterium]
MTEALTPATLRAAYLVLVAAVAAERGVELVLSLRNAARVRARGGIEVGAGHYPAMVALHAAFLVSCALESALLGRSIVPAVALPLLGLLAASMALRYWAIATLGDRWNTRVLVEPGAPAVGGGPYRFLAHPNYLAVVVEIAALPLIGGAWATAAVFSALNAALLRHRIRVEEEALSRHCDWQRVVRGRAGGAAGASP